MMRALLGVVTVAAVISVVSTGFAQGTQKSPRVELTETQEKLNAEAFQAAIDGNYDKAIRLYRSSLNEGEANITLLNLGRALASTGQCDKAIEMYDKVDTAPAVDEPSPADVAKILERFRGDLPEQCPGKIEITCDPLTMKVQIDDDPPRNCPAHPIDVAAGPHTVLGILGDESVAERVDVTGLQTVHLDLRIGDEKGGEEDGEASATNATRKMDTDAPPADTNAFEEEGISALGIAGWSLAGAGVAMAIAGTIVGGVVVQPHLDELRDAAASGDDSRYSDLKDQVKTEQTVMISLWAAGGAVAVAGLTMAIYDLARPKSLGSEADTTALNSWIHADGAGLSWEIRW